jgi:Domain of unknown function (DUF4262)
VALNAIEEGIVAGVAKHGWYGMHVLADQDFPGFTYSIGFWESVGSPDFLIYGLSKNLMHSMLWEMFRQLKGGRRVEDGARVSDLIEGFDCIVRPIHESRLREHLGSALWYRRHKLGDDSGLQGWQIFWPGREQGLFPWERGCSEDVRGWQPLLYLPDANGLA